MSYLQVRLNYNCQANPSVVFRELLAPLQRSWARRYFYGWTVARSWHNGRHILLTLDCDDPFFEPGMREQAQSEALAFLARHPSEAYDIEKHIATQTALNEVEAARIDPSWVAPNNTCDLSQRELGELALRYEAPAQWLSIFATETRLRPVLLRQCLIEGNHERFACELLTLLACVYPPVPADEPAPAEYNGFLSYHSHYRLWHHRLSSSQRGLVDERFTAGYERDRSRFIGWWEELEEHLSRGDTQLRELCSVLLGAFVEFTRMVVGGVIHDRSPYPRDRLAARESVPEFHRRFFYAADGSPHRFSQFFSAYRWLLNIIYRNLPMLDVSPITRHYLNYCLYEMQLERLDLIGRLRTHMLVA